MPPHAHHQDHTEDEPAWVDLFLHQLRRHGLINAAATTAGVTKRTVDRLRERSAEFDYAVETALEEAADVLELEARRRAVEGVEKGVYYQGDEVAREVVYSDQLLTTLLKAKRADEFAERKQITGAGGKPITVVIRAFGETSDAQQPQSTLLADASATGVDPESREPITVEFREVGTPSPVSPALTLADVLDMV